MLMKVLKDTKREVLKLLLEFKKYYVNERFNVVCRDLDLASPADHVHSFANGNISESYSNADG